MTLQQRAAAFAHEQRKTFAFVNDADYAAMLVEFAKASIAEEREACIQDR
jgi:hypothetical protein